MKSDKQIISDRQKKTSIKGTVGEYQTIADYTRQGYWVAKSVDPSCPFDIVIVDKNGKMHLIDVKCATFRKNKKGKSLKNKPKGSYRISRSPTKEQKRLNIKLKMFHYD